MASFLMKNLTVQCNASVVMLELLLSVLSMLEDISHSYYPRPLKSSSCDVQAWAEAFVSGCAAAENGSSFILAEQNSFGRATAVPAITAFAWAEAGAECGSKCKFSILTMTYLNV